MIYLESLSHLWYHTRENKKFENLGFITYYACEILEYIGVFNSPAHKIHHNHGENKREDVEYWMDLGFFTSTNYFFDQYFRFVLNYDIDNPIVLFTIKFWKLTLPAIACYSILIVSRYFEPV
jgi:hypothetical protein